MFYIPGGGFTTGGGDVYHWKVNFFFKWQKYECDYSSSEYFSFYCSVKHSSTSAQFIFNLYRDRMYSNERVDSVDVIGFWPPEYALQFFHITHLQGAVRNLVSRGVVVVTINYRVGVIGFFTTFTEAFPPNRGMYDMVSIIFHEEYSLKIFVSKMLWGNRLVLEPLCFQFPKKGVDCIYAVIYRWWRSNGLRKRLRTLEETLPGIFYFILDEIARLKNTEAKAWKTLSIDDETHLTTSRSSGSAGALNLILRALILILKFTQIYCNIVLLIYWTKKLYIPTVMFSYLS